MSKMTKRKAKAFYNDEENNLRDGDSPNDPWEAWDMDRDDDDDGEWVGDIYND